MLPDPSAHSGDGIAEGTVRLWVPGGSGGSERRLGSEVMRPEGDEREQAKQRRGGAQNGEVGPLALSFDAEMGACVLEGDLKLPAGDEPLEDIDGSGVEIGTEEGLRLKLADWIADQQPSDRHRGQARVVPDGGAGSEFDDAIGAAIPEGDGMALPNGTGVLQHLIEFGQALSFDRRSSAAPASGRCGGIKIGVEAQSGDDAEVASDGGEEPDACPRA